MADNALGANGLTDVNHQRIIAASYGNFGQSPIKAGCVVTGTQGMSYAVSSGVVVVKVDADKALEVAIPATTTAATTAPASGQATDIIFFDPATGQVRVTRGAAPAGACILDQRIVPAGITATTATTSSFDRVHAMPYGASLGQLARWVESWSEGQAALRDNGAGQPIVMCDLSFAVPTNRIVDVQLTQCIKGPDTDTGDRGCFAYTVLLNGAQVAAFELGFDRRKQVAERNLRSVPAAAGRNTLRVLRRFAWGAAPVHFGGGAGGADRAAVIVTDVGPRA